MKKVLYAVLVVLLLLAAAGFAIPLLVDANQYKPTIEAQIKAATGYEIAIKGEIKLSLFPRPRLHVDEVSLFSNSRSFATIEEISAYPKLSPLFSGKLAVDSIKLEKPVLSLVRNEAGDNWANPETGAPVALKENLSIHIVSVEVVDGKVDFSDKIKNKTYSLSGINLDTGITSITGPVSFKGEVKYKDLPINIKGRLDYFHSPILSVNATILGSEIFYEGTDGRGKFSLKSPDISALAEILNADEIKQLARLPLDIRGGIAYEKDKFDLENLAFTIGDTVGEGDFSMALDNRIEADAYLKFSNINLDQLLPRIMSKAAENKDDKENNNEQKAILADLDIVADSVTYSGVAYKNLEIKATTEDDIVTLQPLKFDFPGSGGAEVYGVLSRDTGGRVFEGHISAVSANFRDILQSLGVNREHIKPEMLAKFKLDSELVVNFRDKISVELSQTALGVDDSNFSGNISTDIAKLPSVDINGTVSGVDLDKYIIAAKNEAPDEKQRETGATDDKPFRINWLEKLPLTGSVNILVGKFTYGGDLYNNLRLSANFKPGILNVEEIIAAGKRIQLAAKGSVFAYPGKKPKITVEESNIGKIDLADFIKTDEGPNTKAEDKSRWNKKVFDLSFIRKLDMDFSGNILGLTHGKLVFDNIATKFYIENGKLVVEKLSCGLFGGKIIMNGNIEASAVPALGLAYSATNVEIGKLLEALSDNNRVSGKAGFSGSLSTSGIYQLAMMNNLSGTFVLSSNNLVVRGFDLDGLAGQIVNTNNIADVSAIARTVSGEEAVTYLKNVKGGITVENGTARTQGQGIEMQAASGPGVYTSKADLVNWDMDSYARFKLTTPDGKVPAASIHIYGPLDDPKKELNLDEIKRYIAGRGAKLLLNDNPVETEKPTDAPNNSPVAQTTSKGVNARQEMLKKRAAIAKARHAGWQPAVQE